MANLYQGPPAVDFYSMLSGLGDTLQNNAKLAKQNQLDENRKAAFSDFTALDPRSPDYGKQALTIAQKLGQAGDQEGAVRFLGLAQSASDRTRQDQRDAVTDQHWNASFGLQKRAADRADDPTPSNFVRDGSVPGGYRPIGPADPAYIESVSAAKARAAAAVPPDGFARQADGTLAPLPGGPQDPTYQARVEAERAKAKADVPTIIGSGSSVIIPSKAAEGPIFTNKPVDDGLSTTARDIKARQLINGDTSGLTNIGRGAQAGRTLESISNRAAEILTEEGGMTPQEAAAHLGSKIQAFKASGMGQSAEARTAGVREANLNLILRATDSAIPAALEASDAVARTGWVPVNRVIQHGEVMASNPELKRFGMANLQLAEHWARAMNPTGVMRESDRDKALEFLSTADSPSTYRAAVGQLKTQITRERDAVRSAPVTPSSPSFRSEGINPGAGPSGQGRGADAMLQHARDAIAQGAPRDAVLKRLKDAGIDAGSL